MFNKLNAPILYSKRLNEQQKILQQLIPLLTPDAMHLIILKMTSFKLICLIKSDNCIF